MTNNVSVFLIYVSPKISIIDNLLKQNLPLIVRHYHTHIYTIP